MNQRAPYPILAVALASGLLAACATAPTPAPSPSPSTPAFITEPSPLERADALMQQAATAGEPESSQLRLRAAELYVVEGDANAAVRALRGVQTAQLPADLRVMPAILRAELALQQGHPLPALNILPVPAPEHGDAQNARIQSAYADGLFQIGDLPYAVEALVLREAFLREPDAIDENRAELWTRLLAAPLAPSMFERAEALDPTTRGWLELARLARSVWVDPTARQSAAADWRERFFGHPGADRYLTEAIGQAAQAVNPPARVALLLPQTGPYAAPGQAVRDGFIAAWMQAGGLGEILLYDTGQDDLFATVQAALAQSPDIIVGPLRRELVDELARMPTEGVPVLALNQASNAPSGSNRMYQFALSPEEEARQIADRGDPCLPWPSACRHVVALYSPLGPTTHLLGTSPAPFATFSSWTPAGTAIAKLPARWAPAHIFNRGAGMTLISSFLRRPAPPPVRSNHSCASISPVISP